MKHLLPLLMLPGMALATPASAMDMGHEIFTSIKIDQLEHRWQSGDDLVAVKGALQMGADGQKIVLKAESEYLQNAHRFERAEFQIQYRHAISDFFDAYAGLRHDVKPDPTRSYATFGITGLAPHWVEIDVAGFVSETGGASARLDVSYEIPITQKIYLEPDMELEASLKNDAAIDVGRGFSKLETGLRLRYEITRKIAPYIGINWERRLGETSRLVRAAGEDPDLLSAVIGIKLMF